MSFNIALQNKLNLMFSKHEGLRHKKFNHKFHKNNFHTEGKNSMTLVDAIPGKKYKVVKVMGGCKLNCRLCAMGFMPDEVFNVYAASRGGPVCISIKGSKFAIGRGMADRIFIQETE